VPFEVAIVRLQRRRVPQVIPVGVFEPELVIALNYPTAIRELGEDGLAALEVVKNAVAILDLLADAVAPPFIDWAGTKLIRFD
jgi:hypothetical protein